MNMEVTLVYLLGGISQRFGGGIKALAPVGPHQEPLLEISLQQALPASFSKVVFIVSPATQAAFKNRFGNSYQGTPLFYAVQTYDSKKRDKPWGTADALCTAIPLLLDGPFILCNGDDLYGSSSFKQVKQFLLTSSDNIVVGYPLKNVLPAEGSVNRGVIISNEEKEIRGICEELNITRKNIIERGLSLDSMCSMNLFGMQCSLLPLLQDYVMKFQETHKDHRTSECLLPQFVTELICTKKARFKLSHSSSQWIGITYVSDVECARTELQKSND